MKAKAIAGILLIAAAVQADARLAPPYPRKALPPDEAGQWIVINGDSWLEGAEPEHLIPTRFVVNKTLVNDSTQRRLNLNRRPSVF